MRRVSGSRARRAIDLCAHATTVEVRGDVVDGPGERAAVLAHFSTSPRLTRSFVALVSELERSGYRVVVVSSATCEGPLDWGEHVLGGTTVVRKPNVGYDFGSWAVGLDLFPALAGAPALILANDSLVGPFAPIDALLDQFHSTAADVWGLTQTLQFRRHIQSYFLGFRGGVLRERPLAAFWRGVRHFEDKNLVIHRHELGLAGLLESEGFAVDAAFVGGQVVDPADNPTIAGWQVLLDRGLPFVKREIVRSPGLAPGGELIASEVRRRFGTEIDQWL